MTAARDVLDRIESTQMDAIREVAELSATAIEAGGHAHEADARRFVPGENRRLDRRRAAPARQY